MKKGYLIRDRSCADLFVSSKALIEALDATILLVHQYLYPVLLKLNRVRAPVGGGLILSLLGSRVQVIG